ncbi:hypothetical protein PoB_006973600 [Plakobranchus ocellatus]|uniref:Uncharacterized protein n=1 Tax=Plakobranchus ocellatus TaxID=259542 RepID=A0AAV4DHA0_9GAST|nr:hypothetical protein PoB_006973600 [Plakobranchus ocellatus]
MPIEDAEEAHVLELCGLLVSRPHDQGAEHTQDGRSAKQNQILQGSRPELEGFYLPLDKGRGGEGCPEKRSSHAFQGSRQGHRDTATPTKPRTNNVGINRIIQHRECKSRTWPRDPSDAVYAYIVNWLLGVKAVIERFQDRHSGLASPLLKKTFITRVQERFRDKQRGLASPLLHGKTFITRVHSQLCTILSVNCSYHRLVSIKTHLLQLALILPQAQFIASSPPIRQPG